MGPLRLSPLILVARKTTLLLVLLCAITIITRMTDHVLLRWLLLRLRLLPRYQYLPFYLLLHYFCGDDDDASTRADNQYPVGPLPRTLDRNSSSQ